MDNFWAGRRVLVTGAGGFVGRALMQRLGRLNAFSFVIPSRLQFDLRREAEVSDLFRVCGRVDVLFHLAANVGGIGANQKSPADMYSDNVRMDTLLISAAARNRVGCFVGMGSVCAYPKFATIPFQELDLWNGYPEETNAAYGIAKRGMLACLQAHGQQLGLDWRYALSTNLYGPGNSFDEGGHVIAELIRKFSAAVIHGDRSVTLWGTGKATRDFLYVDDVVSGLLALAEHGTTEPVNLGSGEETTIRYLAQTLSEMTGYRGEIVWDANNPDGQPRRVLDIQRARMLGWEPTIGLEDGLLRTISEYSSRREYA